MKNIFVILLALTSMQLAAQSANLSSVKEQAQKEGKYILITFSGSDWCIPCIRLEKEVFTNDSFQQFAKSCLVILNADFPRLKKHQLPKEQKKANEALAEIYNKQGAFPYTVLADKEGHVLKSWDGSSVGSAEQFVKEIKQFIHD